MSVVEKKRKNHYRSNRLVTGRVLTFHGDIGQVVIGDVHQLHSLNKHLCAVVVALTVVAGWALCQLSPSADASIFPLSLVCTVEQQDYAVGRVKRERTGQIVECLNLGKDLAPQ